MNLRRVIPIWSHQPLTQEDVIRLAGGTLITTYDTPSMGYIVRTDVAGFKIDGPAIKTDGQQGTFMQGADKPRLFTDPPSSLTTWGMGVPAFDTDKKDD